MHPHWKRLDMVPTKEEGQRIVLYFSAKRPEWRPFFLVHPAIWERGNNRDLKIKPFHPVCSDKHANIWVLFIQTSELFEVHSWLLLTHQVFRADFSYPGFRLCTLIDLWLSLGYLDDIAA